MKTVYIPKGETVHYESLTTEHLVVHGRLHVTYGVKAQSITGSGVIDASSINADTVCIDDVESGTVICKRLIAKRVQAPEVFASESAAVSCFLSAAYVETGKLTAAISEVDEVVAQEVVNLTPKKRTLFGTLFASMLRSFWTALTAPGQKAEVLDAEFVPAQEDHTETVQNEGSAEFSASDQSVPEVEEKQEDVVDEELNRIVGLFKLSREQGYTPMFFYPFSNVHSNDRVCTGNNVLPRYRKISALKNFPRYLLGLPDNDDMYDREHNRLKLSHGELLEHLKDKDPAYYYTDILVSNGKTLGDFISRR